MKKNIFVLFIILITVSVFAKPKNIILVIGDGMGFNHLKIANYYEKGRWGKQIYQKFPVKLAMSTWSNTNGSYDKDIAWESYEYLQSGFTDSAAAITAMTTGVKTDNTKLNYNPNGEKLTPIGDHVVNSGKALGVVTTVPFPHATPAGILTSMEYRKDYHQIGQNMIFDSKATVIMSGGSPDYRKKKQTKYIGPTEFWNWLKEEETTYNERQVQDIDGDGQPDPWSFVTLKDDFLALQKGDTPKRVIGVNVSVKNGQQTRKGDRKANPYVVPFQEDVPSLQEMTAAAINILDEDEDGFFLMIEGGAIDYTGHYQEPGRLVEEMDDFNNTIEYINDWVKKNSNWKETLVIVTADHECGCVWGPSNAKKQEFNKVKYNGKGKLPGFVFNSSDHTNSLVPFYAKGSDAKRFKKLIKGKDKHRGKYIDNTDLGRTLRELLN